MGAFGAPQGVRGEVRVKSLTADPTAIGAYGPLTDKDRGRKFVFESLRALKDDMLVARVAGVSTRDAAEALTGVEMFARRDQLPPPSEDEFYHDDLIGLEAVDAAGAQVGRVVSLMNYGGGDVLEIASTKAAKLCCCRSPSAWRRASISTPDGSSSSRRAKSRTKSSTQAHRMVAKGAGGGYTRACGARFIRRRWLEARLFFWRRAA